VFVERIGGAVNLIEARYHQNIVLAGLRFSFRRSDKA
jgi:phosphosulfolactate synthase (CoM biosynthesis protein A)